MPARRIHEPRAIQTDPLGVEQPPLAVHRSLQALSRGDGLTDPRLERRIACQFAWRTRGQEGGKGETGGDHRPEAAIASAMATHFSA